MPLVKYFLKKIHKKYFQQFFNVSFYSKHIHLTNCHLRRAIILHNEKKGITISSTFITHIKILSDWRRKERKQKFIWKKTNLKLIFRINEKSFIRQPYHALETHYKPSHMINISTKIFSIIGCHTNVFFLTSAIFQAIYIKSTHFGQEVTESEDHLPSHGY